MNASINSHGLKIHAPLIASWLQHLWRQRSYPSPLVIGLCGAQGSGKTTLARELERELVERDLRVANVSLDDFYLSHAARQTLAARIHPLLATRGVPGTHDVPLLTHTLDALDAGRETLIPRFDKSTDDPAPPSAWTATGPVDALIFEGWCVGARAQSSLDLWAPINDLEREEDVDGVWRSYVNTCLAEQYAHLFTRLDALVLLAAPSFDCVLEWRQQQERELRNRCAMQSREEGSAGLLQGLRIMDEAGIRRFIQHFERLTRHMLAEMPHRADRVLYLDEERRVSRTSLAARG